MHLSHFIHQKENEHVVYMLRRHWLTFIPALVLFVVMLLVPVIFYTLINNLFPQITHAPMVYPVLVLLGSVFYLSSYVFFYIRFIDYYLDLWVVTNSRIIDIAQNGLFDRIITELELFRIQDVTTDVRGVFATIFHYGDLIVTTASNTNSIIFHQIPHPDVVRQALIQLADVHRKTHQTVGGEQT